MNLNDSTEGRWLTPDLLGGDITNPQSLNRYAYALNNPATLTDPSGLATCYDSQGDAFSCPDPIGTSVTVTANVGPGDPILQLIFDIADCLNPLSGCPLESTQSQKAPAPAPKPAPPALQVSTAKLIQSFNQCAANFADKYSLASLLHVSNTPVLGSLLGSSSAAASHVLFGTHPNEYVPAGANLAAGVKAGFALRAGAAQAGAIPIDQGFQSIFTTIAPTSLGQTAAGRVLLNGVKGLGDLLDVALPVQIGIDEFEYGAGEAACTAQALGGG